MPVPVSSIGVVRVPRAGRVQQRNSPARMVLSNGIVLRGGRRERGFIARYMMPVP
jgi:hypothetical protein